MLGVILIKKEQEEEKKLFDSRTTQYETRYADSRGNIKPVHEACYFHYPSFSFLFVSKILV